MSKCRKFHGVIIFFGMAEHYHVLRGRSGNLMISLSFMFLCIFHGLLKLNPSKFLQFYLFILLITSRFYQLYQQP